MKEWSRHRISFFAGKLGFVLLAAVAAFSQQMVTSTRDPNQAQDEDFAKTVKEWTTAPYFTSPLVDHLPKVSGIPSPKDSLGYHIGAPNKLTYYADILKYYRALAAATPRLKIETIGKSDENRELVVIYVSSDENIKNLQQNKANLARLADPRGSSDAEIQRLIATTKPHYHFMGGLHSGEVGPSEMLMELAYRLATETSPLITQIRNNVIVSITPAAEPDGRDRNVDWFYRGLENPTQEVAGAGGGRGGAAGVPYWGKYVYHDNNRDINFSQMSMRALLDWYLQYHPPIIHDLHESQPLLYTYSGAAPQNPNLDPILWAELPWFSNFEMSQMTKWGMPGVWTHNFMDGWSPGYLGSMAYNHNGMMRMYETQGARGGGRGGPPPGGGEGVEPGALPPPFGAASEAGGGGRVGGQGSEPGAGRAGGGFGGRGGAPGTRQWYQGIPVPAQYTWSMRNNTNYMETGVLCGLQLTSMFPNLIVENFYTKSRNSIESGKTQPPHAFVIPPQRDMTRVASFLGILRMQGIEVGQATSEIKVSDGTFPAGSYVIKRDQPYGRLAKTLLERQQYPDPNLRTYDDSGWTMGLALLTEVKPINDKAILTAATKQLDKIVLEGKVEGNGSAGLAVAHFGSNNMISFRYKLKNASIRIVEKSFTPSKIEFPPGSFVVTGSSADLQAARAAAGELGLTAAGLSSAPDVPMHDADAPRVAMYSTWNGTQEIGWVRYTFDQFGIPYDLIYKERVKQGNLRRDYDVIVMPTQNAGRAAVFQPPANQPVPYLKSEKYKSLGVYGESPDITGGMGGEGAAEFAKFLDAGGTLITMGSAVSFPAEMGFARSVDASGRTSTQFYAPRPIVQGEIVKPEHPVFYGYTERNIPVKYHSGPLMSVGVPDQSTVLARYVGGDAAVLSGLMRGADEIRGRPFAIDVPGGYTGKGHVLLFSNNPIYRWQNHGEFNMVFNAIMNWNDLPTAPPPRGQVSTIPRER